MRKYTKTGLLILTLAFPVLIFVFLKVFANNRYDLPYFVPLRDASNNVVMQPGGDTTFYQVPDSSLPADGGSFGADALRGKSVLVSTLSSPCGDTCQKVLNQLVRAQGLHQDYPSFVILTLTGEADSQIISEVKARRQSETGWLVSALPSSTLSSTVQDIFRLGENVPGMQTISPSARLSLVDGAGFVRGFYDTTDPEEIDRLMAEIRILEHNREVQK